MMQLSAPPPAFSGWGSKQGSRVRTWKKRYFVLIGRELVYYGGSGRDGFGVDEKGRVLVTGVEYAPDLRHGLLVRGAKKSKELRMTMSTAEQSRALFAAIRAALGEVESVRGSALAVRKETASGGFAPPPRAESSSVIGTIPISREGWLVKEELEGRAAEQVYVTLSGNVLTYYADQAAPALESDVVEFVSQDGRSPLTLVVTVGESRVVLLTGETREDIAEWGTAMSRAIGNQVASFGDDDRAASGGQSRDVRYCEGWLEKRGARSKTWKSRYFFLADGILEYRKSPTGQTCAENLVIDVNLCDENPEWLEIVFASDSEMDKHRLCVRAASTAELTQWIVALCVHVGKPPLQLAEPTVASVSTPSSSPDESPRRIVEQARSPPLLLTPATAAPSEDQLSLAVIDPSIGPHMVNDGFHGWLLKKGQHFKTWKRRYFVLTRGRLDYSASVKGAILGSGVVFGVAVSNQRPFSLDVRFQNGRLLHVAAPTRDVFSRWLMGLQAASDLTESFLSQRRDSNSDETAIEDAFFDNDPGEAENGRDAEFTEADLADYQSQLGTGAALWADAMKGLNESEAWENDSDKVEELDEPEPPTHPDALTTNSLDGGKLAECHGWMLKQGGSTTSWKRRYFTLYGSTLKYYKSETGALLRSLVVEAVSEVVSSPLTIEVLGAHNRKIVVAAESNQDYIKWFAALQASSLSAQHRSSESVMSSDDLDYMVESDKLSATYSGWLEKEGQRFRTWKKRFFEFKNGALIYYNSAGGSALGHGKVDHAFIDSSRPHTLTIEFRHRRPMRVTAASDEDMKAWLAVMTKERSGSADTEPLSDAGDFHSEQAGPLERSVERVNANRLDAGDYFANDTVTDDTYRRIQGFGANSSVVNTMNEADLSFKGELAFGKRVVSVDDSHTADDAVGDEEDPGELLDTANDAEYHRQLVEESASALERRELADEARRAEMPPAQPCAACCVVM